MHAFGDLKHAMKHMNWLDGIFLNHCVARIRDVRHRARRERARCAAMTSSRSAKAPRAPQRRVAAVRRAPGRGIAGVP